MAIPVGKTQKLRRGLFAIATRNRADHGSDRWQVYDGLNTPPEKRQRSIAKYWIRNVALGAPRPVSEDEVISAIGAAAVKDARMDGATSRSWVTFEVPASRQPAPRSARDLGRSQRGRVTFDDGDYDDIPDDDEGFPIRNSGGVRGRYGVLPSEAEFLRRVWPKYEVFTRADGSFLDRPQKGMRWEAEVAGRPESTRLVKKAIKEYGIRGLPVSGEVHLRDGRPIYALLVALNDMAPAYYSDSEKGDTPININLMDDLIDEEDWRPDYGAYLDPGR